ncbi:hypothetical protein CCMA1212_005643 [Trichoderma ghanense]|uniref:Uncharacterized protein n=1 Tax=Trichoderma ghanense TaxID=65468 RepID=A0ABY2H291_9HYPO
MGTGDDSGQAYAAPIPYTAQLRHATAPPTASSHHQNKSQLSVARAFQLKMRHGRARDQTASNDASARQRRGKSPSPKGTQRMPMARSLAADGSMDSSSSGSWTSESMRASATAATATERGIKQQQRQNQRYRQRAHTRAYTRAPSFPPST